MTDRSMTFLVKAVESEPNSSLPVVGTFHSVQGEGAWTDINAFFIRLAYCDVGCSWGDTKHFWNPKRYPQHEIVELVAFAQAANPQIVGIT